MTKLEEKRAILIVGATGHIGSCLTHQILVTTDYFVNVLIRDEERAHAMFGEGIQSGRPRVFVTKQLTSGDLLRAMAGVDVVVWCVGPRSRPRFPDLISSSPDSSKTVDYVAVQQLCDAVKHSTTLQRIVMIEPPEVGRPYRLGTILGNLTQNYIYYWKANGESLIKGSGLDYTIIRPHSVQCSQTSLHRDVGEISFHQGPASLWRLKRYPPIPLAALTDIICQTIDRLDQTRRCTFEVSGDPSRAKSWDELFEKLQPDHETKPKSIVTRHRIAIGFGITCSLLGAAGLVFAAMKYASYDTRLPKFYSKE